MARACFCGWKVSFSEKDEVRSKSGDLLGIDVSAFGPPRFVPNPLAKDKEFLDVSHDRVDRDVSRWINTGALVENAVAVRKLVSCGLAEAPSPKGTRLEVWSEPPEDPVPSGTFRIGVGSAVFSPSSSLSACLISSPRSPKKRVFRELSGVPLFFAVGSYPNVGSDWRGPLFGYVPSWAAAVWSLFPSLSKEWDPCCPEAVAAWIGVRKGARSISFFLGGSRAPGSGPGLVLVPGEVETWAFPEEGPVFGVLAGLASILKREGFQVEFSGRWVPPL